MYIGTYNRLHVPVTASNRAVIRAARMKIAPKARNHPAFRDARKRFYREMLAIHAKASGLVQRWRL